MDGWLKVNVVGNDNEVYMKNSRILQTILVLSESLEDKENKNCLYSFIEVLEKEKVHTESSIVSLPQRKTGLNRKPIHTLQGC